MRFSLRVLAKAYFHRPGTTPLLHTTIGQQLQLAAQKTPDRLAAHFYVQNVQYTFEQLLKQVTNVGANLLQLGVKKGDRVGILDGNSSEWLITQLATAKIGAILVNVNPLFHAAEIRYALEKSGASVLICREKIKQLNFLASLREISPAFANTEPTKELNVPQLPNLKKVVLIGPQALPGTFTTFAELQRQPSAQLLQQAEQAEAKVDCDDATQIIFTSGTTGLPKGATLTHHMILNCTYVTGERMNLGSERDIAVTQVPFFHFGGCVLSNMQIVTHNVSLVAPSLGYDSEKGLEAVQATKATAFFGTPTMFLDMINHPKRSHFDLSSLRKACVGGAPVQPSLVDGMKNDLRVPRVWQIYGSTESCIVSQSTLEDDDENVRSTVGPIHDHMEVKVVNRDGQTCQVGEEGEIWSRGYGTMLNYWNDPAKTAEAITPARWYRTGDLGVLTQSGHLKISGRIKDLVIRGGTNIYPAEVEKFMLLNRNIADVSVVGVPDSRLGEELCACVILKDGHSATAQELAAFLHGKVAKYKVPKYYLFVQHFPLTISRKVKKFELRERAIKELQLNSVEPHLKY